MTHALTLRAATLLALAAIQPLHAQHEPPIRQLGRRLAVSTDTLGSINNIRQLNDGRVFVNDVTKRRLILYDSTLSHGVVVADSTSGTHNTYGHEPGGVVPYRGDTTLFIDATSLSLLVIDPRGSIIRVISAPHPTDLGSLMRFINGAAGFDAQGRLVYKITGTSIVSGGIHFESPGLVAARHGLNADGTPSTATEDSISVVRVDLTTRATDTVGFVTIPRPLPNPPERPAPNGTSTIVTSIINPVPAQRSDGWALVADGSIAFIRALDYHIDWVNADGTRRSTPKMVHDWERLTDSAKIAIVDSTRRFWAANEAYNDSASKARGRPLQYIQHFEVVDPTDIGDYRQPFGQILADMENNIWIRQSAPSPPAGAAAGPPPPPIYDIVSRAGVVVDRVQLPPSLTLLGFGPGVAYLTSREGTGAVLVKYRIH